MEKNKETKILIVEDHPIFRMGMKELINQESDLNVCGEAEDVIGARRTFSQIDPDMVIVDLSLKGSNGMDLIKEFSSSGKGVPVLVLSMHDESLHAQRCLRAGARGYIMKQEASVSVVTAIRRILQGNIFVGDRVMSQILNTVSKHSGALEKSPVGHLTDRELEVFRLIGNGLSTGAIAGQLSLSARTVGTYRERIKEKLGLKDSGELVRYAVLWVENLLYRTN